MELYHQILSEILSMEEIMCVFEALGSGCGGRHDFG